MIENSGCKSSEYMKDLRVIEVERVENINL